MITVEGKHIGEFYIDDITYSIQRVACNSINEIYTCKSFSMSVHADCNLNKKSEWTIGVLDEEREPLQRLNKNKDITSIYIYFNNKQEPLHVYVPWGGDSEYNNEYQKTCINKFGDLFIVINKEKELEDVIDLDEIEDESYREFIWEMYE